MELVTAGNSFTTPSAMWLNYMEGACRLRFPDGTRVDNFTGPVENGTFILPRGTLISPGNWVQLMPVNPADEQAIHHVWTTDPAGDLVYLPPVDHFHTILAVYPVRTSLSLGNVVLQSVDLFRPNFYNPNINRARIIATTGSPLRMHSGAPFQWIIGERVG